MNLNMENKCALVTGSTNGIGLAIAAVLVGEGARVIVTGRSQTSVTSALEQIRSRHPAAIIEGFVGNLSEVDGIGNLVARFPQVDILVNNLGIFEAKPFQEIPDEDWFRFFDINVMSGVRLSRAYLPGMKESNWGRVIFISSESGIQIPAEMIHYGMTKTAQLSISRGLAETCKGTGVTVNAVLPGPTRSAGVDVIVSEYSNGRTYEEYQQRFFQKARPTSLLQRFAAPEEVASMVAFLCSPLASATNGAALRVEGGIVRSCF